MYTVVHFPEQYHAQLTKILNTLNQVRNRFFLIYIYLFVWLCQLLVIAHEPLVAACAIYFPDQGLNPGPQH